MNALPTTLAGNDAAPISAAPKPQPRPEVAGIPAYVAGKVPAERPGMTVYKVSSNENPYPPLPGVLEAANKAAQDINRYPDFGAAELCAMLADKLGLAPEQVVAATGSSAIIFHLLSAYCARGDEVIYPWRSFEAYPIAVAASGATSVQVPNLADGSHDLEMILSAITEHTKVIMLCTPNNPTGNALTQTQLNDFLAQVPSHILVLLDEAYTEFVRMDDAIDAVATVKAHDNVIVSRTFSKAYGLAGLRVGYAFGTSPLIAALRATVLPFAVNMIAQAAALESLRREDELLVRVNDLVTERERVVKGLRDAGWDIADTQANFVWFAFPGDLDRIKAFAAAADELGLMVRALGTDGVRITIGEDEANTRIIELGKSFPH